MNRILLLAVLLCFSAPVRAQNTLTLTSPLLGEGKEAPRSMVYNENECTGENISPPLDWANAPDGASGFALTMYDPDARGAADSGQTNNQGWLHWAVFNIPADAHSLPANAGSSDGKNLPRGANSIANSFGASGYSGPCPPAGSNPHRYEFTIYAMPDAYTFYPLSAIGQPTISWLKEHALEFHTLTVTYQR